MTAVTLIYQDTTTWFAGVFGTLDEANAWIAAEKTRPYWNESTQVQIETITIEASV